MKEREKTEAKMYAILVDTEEIYRKCVKEQDKTAEETAKKWVEVVHPDPLGRFQALLFLTPEGREKAYPHIKEVFQSATMAAQVAYVDSRYLQDTGKGGNRH